MTVVLIDTGYNHFSDYFQGYLSIAGEYRYNILSLHSPLVPGGTTIDEMMSMLLAMDYSTSVSYTSSSFYNSISSYSAKGYGDCEQGGNHTVERAFVYSNRGKVSFNASPYLSDFNYDVNVCGTPNQAGVSRNDGSFFDSGNPNWQEGVGCLLEKLEAKDGVSVSTDWIGYGSYFPQPVFMPPPSDPQNRYENKTGFEMLVYGLIDFAVPGGFEFIEEFNT